MGSFPSRKTSSAFDPKSLKITLATEISVIIDEKMQKKSISNLKIHDEQIDHMSKNDPKLFTYFLCSKFDALKELNLDDNLDDGNPIEIRKIDINKKLFPKKNSNIKLSKFNNSNKNLSKGKIQKPIHPKRKQFSCVNVKKGEFYKVDDLKEKSNFVKNNEFILHEGNCKSPQNLKIRRHRKHNKSKKNKDYKKSPSISIIKPNNSYYDNKIEDDEKNSKDSLEPIRLILEEMGI